MRDVTVFLGRDKELGLLRHAVANLERGRGGVVVVEGEPGIGKSALLRAALADLGTITVCWGAADELGQRFPLRALLECFTPEHRGEIVGSTQQGEWFGAVHDPVLAALERLLSFVDRRCADGPVAIVLDDLHWADDTSLLAFSRLARLTTQLPLLLVSASRPVPGRPELGQLRRSLLASQPVVITLRPLRAEEATELAGAVAGAPAGPRLTELVANAGGNPLYVQELVTGLLREDRIEVRDTAELTAAEGVISAPASLGAAIDERLRFLPDSTTALLRVAALFGTRFTFEDLARVTGRPPGKLLADVETAVATGVLETHGDQLSFRHPLIRAVLHDSTSAGFRTALHRQAARTLAESGTAAERVAEHLLSAPDTVRDEWALDWLTREVPALAARSPKITADLLERALGVLGDNDERREPLQRWLVVLLRLLRDFDRAAELAHRVRQHTTDQDCADQMTWILGYCLLGTRHPEDAVEVLTTTLEGREDVRPWTARLRGLLSIVVSSTGKHTQGAEIAEQAAVAAEACGDRYAIAFAAHAGSIAIGRWDVGRSMELNNHGLAAVPSGPDGVDLRLLMLGNRTQQLIVSDGLADARVVVREAVELAERTGAARLANLRVVAAQVAFAAGQWDDAVAEIEPVDELRRELANYVPSVLVADGLVALISVHRDDLRTAERCLAATGDVEIGPGEMRRHSDFLMLARAAISERRGHRSQAIATLAPATDPDYAKDVTKRIPILPQLVRLALAAGDFGTIAAAMRTVIGEAESDPVLGLRTAADWCRGLVAEEPDTLSAVAAYYRTTGRPFELNLVTEDLAELLAKRGDTTNARALLTDAVAGLAELGATWDVRRAERRLARYGVRRDRTAHRRRPATGLAALTPTELTVARLVATGLSNSDVAARLVLSRRTVHTHVSRILSKLGARSRVEIARHVLITEP